MLILREIVIPLLFGLALFLFGMKIMESSLQAWAGPRLVRVLNASTTTPLRGLLFSTGITAILQSSTAVTVMTMGLVNAGILTYARSLGIILGGNIGTCLTTELIAFNFTTLGLPLLLFSVSLWTATIIASEMLANYPQLWLHRLRSLQHAALASAGFSIIMIAIRWMQSISPTLQAAGVLEWFTTRAADSVLWGAAAGAILTALIHSSAAVIGMTMTLVGTGALPVELGIAMVIGSNVGTCVTALLASIGGTRSGSFVAWSHVALNVGGALLFLPMISALQHMSALFSDDPATQIAHSQTLFNIICSVGALPLCYLPMWRHPRFKMSES
ncbi:phosphate:Na+ symporter [Paenibacillus shirakamiensis]|uniref:Phosphate:Na+ symporter n=1 Tax=Paenibacillus shirakamiensis TaxID=1265935 RepID=A0ABS4JEY9_9BACL|nr:Na/Pi symporter [Paenibacillus shirakamiensis]MBP1999154.1 phosphate:Na+ symporter [Paenibacillus shirakamiensis]